MATDARAPLWRNPYVVAFVVGCVTVTLLRPLLRYEPKPPPVLSELPAFSLIDSTGKPFGSDDLHGRVWIASFFFTQCPSVCPMLMTRVADLQNRFREAGIDDITLVSISVDPERDGPERLRAVEPGYGVDPERWKLLTGPLAAVHDLCEQGFHVPGFDGSGMLDGDIPHTTKLVLVDPRHRIRGYYETDATGLDEVFHRAQHVRKEATRGDS